MLYLLKLKRIFKIFICFYTNPQIIIKIRIPYFDQNEKKTKSGTINATFAICSWKIFSNK